MSAQAITQIDRPRYGFIRSQSLTEAQIRQKAPSVFATAPHSRVSGRYQLISTVAMIEGMEGQGWFPVHASESRVRLSDRQGYTRHLLRFRRLDDKLPLVGDSFPEIVLVNSHDGSCAYQIHAGLFRLVCSNGMVIADATMGKIRRRHTGDAVGEIIEGTCEIVEDLPRIAGKVNTFREIALSPGEQEVLAASALHIRWSDGKAPVTPASLLQARRQEDRHDDLWTTYQRIQENLLKGGVRGRTRTGRRMTTREVQSVDGNVRLNQALWMLTERMAELKAA
jgi:hypothetical protein